MDANRKARQATLAVAASTFSTYGTDYVTNLKTFESLDAGGKTLTTQITSLKDSLSATNSDIVKNTKLSTDTGASISTEQTTLSTLQAKSASFNAQIASNEAQMIVIQTSIDSLTSQGTASASSKDAYTKSATEAMSSFKSNLDALKIEATQDAAILSSLSAALDSLTALNSDDTKSKINSFFIPN